MNKAYFILFVAGILILTACNTTNKKENNSYSSIVEGQYFGEEPPGLVPKLFDPKIVSPEGFFEGGTFSPDMKEFYFTRKNGKYKKRAFLVIRYENNNWGQVSKTDIRWPQFSADGNTMYIGKEYRERTNSGWSASKSQGEFLKQNAHGLSVSSSGTYYFPFFKKEFNTVHGNLAYSRLINGKYENPVKMSAEINAGKYIAHPYIAPDESYLMWDVEREDGHGQSDIYISFRHKDGSWLTPINMGDQINTSSNESSPRVTHDGKYIFFSRGDWKVKEDGSKNWVGKSYWVDVKIIETLKQDSEINDSDFPRIENRYFDQKLPGLIPEKFAPGIVSTEEYLESVVTFLTDMKEFSFTRSGGKYKEPTLIVMENKNNRWSKKSILSTDEKKYEKRFNPDLSDMKKHEAFKDIPITGFTISAQGTYYFYFINFKSGGIGHMSYSRCINGTYETPIKMSKAINTGKYIAHPFIAPDESYLLWDAEKEGEDTPDIYISFRQKDGSWGTAINMGDTINTPFYEQRARVTPDGKYMFFWKGDVKYREDGSRYVVGGPYWVSAQIIENLRPQ